jgi:hypothetical protein
MARMEKFINDRFAKYGTISECYRDDEIDAVLSIPMDDETALGILDACTQEAWDHVCANKDKYPHNIRLIIEPYRPKTKKRVVELTDQLEEQLKKEKKTSRMKEFEVQWAMLKTSIPDRPMDELDDELDDAWSHLSVAKSSMTEYLDRKNKKYVPPSARRVSDPELTEIEREISECQDIFNAIEKRIQEEDEKYMAQKKNELFEKWLREL